MAPRADEAVLPSIRFFEKCLLKSKAIHIRFVGMIQVLIQIFKAIGFADLG